MAKKQAAATATKTRNRKPKEERIQEFVRANNVTEADEAAAQALVENTSKRVLRLALLLKGKEGAGSRAREIKSKYGVSAFVAKAAAHIEKTLGQQAMDQFLKANA